MVARTASTGGAGRPVRRRDGSGPLLRAARRARPVRSRADGAGAPSPGSSRCYRRRRGRRRVRRRPRRRRVAQRPTSCWRTCRSRPAACTRLRHLLRERPTSTPRRSPTRSDAARRRSATATSAAAATSRRRSPRQCGLTAASGIDVKSFCAAPVHALVVAAALIEAGIEERVVVVAGGSLGKLGMKFEGALDEGLPDHRGRARGHGRVARSPPTARTARSCATDAVGRMPVEAGSRAPGAARGPRRRAARRDGYRRSPTSDRTRPRSTTPRSPSRRAAATSPIATTRCSPGSASCAASSTRADIAAFARDARHAGVLADPGPHRERGAVAPARARRRCAPASCSERC